MGGSPQILGERCWSQLQRLAVFSRRSSIDVRRTMQGDEAMSDRDTHGMHGRRATDRETRADGRLDRLRLATGFATSEREEIVAQFAPLGARLRSFDDDAIDMELSVKERDGADQRVTLEVWIAGRPRLVSTSSRRDLRAALQEVRDDSVRQIEDGTTREEGSRRGLPR